MTSSPSLLQVGRITRPHGVRGELKVHLHFEGSESLWEVDEVIIERPSGKRQTMKVEAVRGTSKIPILVLEAVTTREGAEELRDSLVWVDRAHLAPLEPGEYYLVDLVGCDVFLAGEKLGKITQVRPDMTIDTLVIELLDGSVAEQPLLDAWVGPVDIASRRVELLSDDGLIR